MRILVSFLVALTLGACATGENITYGSGSVDQRQTATGPLDQAAACVAGYTLQQVRNGATRCDVQEQPGVTGLMTTARTSDDDAIRLVYQNGRVLSDTCVFTGYRGSRVACDSPAANDSIESIGRYVTCGNVGQAIRAVNDLTIYDLRNLRGRAAPAGNPEGCRIGDITAEGRDQLLGQATTADGWRVQILRGTQQNGYVLIYINPANAQFTGYRPNQ